MLSNSSIEEYGRRADVKGERLEYYQHYVNTKVVLK